MKDLIQSLVVAACLLAPASAFANDIHLRPERVNACIGRATRVMRSSIQLNEIAINGRTSNAKTFSVNTRLARYTGDVDTADVVAFCYRRGQDVISVMTELNNAFRTRYFVNITVNCVPCG